MSDERNEQELASGARSVAAHDYFVSGIINPEDPATQNYGPSNALGHDPAESLPGELITIIFARGDHVQVKAGNAHNAAELFDGVYNSAEDANYALQAAGVVAAPTFAELNYDGIKLS